MTNLLTNDLNHILAHTKDLWEELRQSSYTAAVAEYAELKEFAKTQF